MDSCLYRLRSLVHREFCLVVKERKRKKDESIVTTDDLPNYYLAQLSCDRVREEEQWTRRDKHICNNKNDMCLTVSHNSKDEGVFLNLMTYETSAKSQQWISRKTSRTTVAVVNVGTSLCLFDPSSKNTTMKAKTTVQRCPQSTWYTDFMFYFEPVNFKDKRICPPL